MKDRLSSVSVVVCCSERVVFFWCRAALESSSSCWVPTQRQLSICRIKLWQEEDALLQTVLTADCWINCCLNFYHSFAVALKHSSVTGICWRQCCVLCIGATSNTVKHRRQTAELQQGTFSSGYRLQNCVTVGPTCLLASQKINQKFVPCLPQNFSRKI